MCKKYLKCMKNADILENTKWNIKQMKYKTKLKKI